MARFAESLGNSPKSTRITWRNQIQRRYDSFLLLIIRITSENLKKGSETGSHHNDSSSTAEVLKEVSSKVFISQSGFMIFFSLFIHLCVTKYGDIRCIDYNNNFFHYVYETKRDPTFLKMLEAVFIKRFRADPRFELDQRASDRSKSQTIILGTWKWATFDEPIDL